LTGLYNRRRFEAELERTVELVRRYREPAALLVLDLDQFKYVNDTYGHPVGDELLRRVAQALATRVRDTDVLCRLGGDEFGLICPHTEAAGATIVADSLLEVVRNQARVTVAERPLRVTASIGVKCVDSDGPLSAEQLMVDADIALYDAKETGRDRASVVAVGSTGAARMRERLTWSQRVREALESGGLVLWEQPILNLASGRLDRTEVLVRMLDPDNGQVIAPGAFLHIAERFGQIHALDRFVISAGIELIANARPPASTTSSRSTCRGRRSPRSR
jgi:diguanylate cyclase (GGDEF)-like protein